MDEIGRDFFMRVQLTRRVVWFECPSSGNVYHSAAKPGGPGGRSKPGKRFCHICNKCFSANNFHSQHLSNLHRPGRPTDLALDPADDAGNVRLSWREPFPGLGGEPEVTGYRLRLSDDNGASWKTIVEDTDCPEPGATVRAEQLVNGCTYRFQVAAINLVGVGSDYSEPSLPVHVDGVQEPLVLSDEAELTSAFSPQGLASAASLISSAESLSGEPLHTPIHSGELVKCAKPERPRPRDGVKEQLGTHAGLDLLSMAANMANAEAAVSAVYGQVCPLKRSISGGPPTPMTARVEVSPRADASPRQRQAVRMAS